MSPTPSEPELPRARRRAPSRRKRPLGRKRFWTDDRILNEIRRLHRAGQSLAPSRVSNALRQVGKLHFGSWRAAVQRAGISYDDEKVVQPKSDADLLAMVRARAREGRTGVGKQGLVTEQMARNLRERFGSVRAAFLAAGLDAKLIRRKEYTEKEVLDELRRLAEEVPDMTPLQLRKSSPGRAAISRYGTLEKALTAARLRKWPKPTLVPLLSPKEVLAAVRRRHRTGQSLNTKDVLREDDRLLRAVYKHYGTWRSALRQARVPYREAPLSSWQIEAELRARRLRGEANSAGAIQRDDPELWSEVIRRYGSLAKAIAAANQP